VRKSALGKDGKQNPGSKRRPDQLAMILQRKIMTKLGHTSSKLVHQITVTRVHKNGLDAATESIEGKKN